MSQQCRTTIAPPVITLHQEIFRKTLTVFLRSKYQKNIDFKIHRSNAIDHYTLNFSTVEDNSKNENICKKCADSSIELIKEKNRVESLKKIKLTLTDMLKMERKTVAKLQKEIDNLKTEIEKINMVR